MTSPAEETADSIRLAHLRSESGIKSIGQLCYLVAFFSGLGTIEFVLFAIGVIPRDDLRRLIPDALLGLFFWFFAVVFALNTVVQVVLGFGLIRLQPWARWTVVVLTAISLVVGTLSSLVLSASPMTSELLEPVLGFRGNSTLIGVSSLVFGIIFHGLILWPLVAPGSGFVFSNRYRRAVRETPKIRSRMHWLLKLFVGSLMMLVLGVLAYLAAIAFGIID